MPTVYCIRDLETGLYRYDGQWAEEPEWMCWAAAKNTVEASYLRQHRMEIVPRQLAREDMAD